MDNIMEGVFLNEIVLSERLKLLDGLIASKVGDIARYQKRRQQQIAAVLQLHGKIMAMYGSKICRAPKAQWKLARSSTFWEADIPGNGEKFFKENFRMSRSCFKRLCDMLSHMERENTPFRDAISLEKRVAIGVYSLGSSMEYRSVANLFGLGRSTVCEIVLEFCQELWHTLRMDYLNAYPLTKERIQENISGFEKLGFPQCFGAIDGCHIEVKPHASDAVDYYNYKGWYSTVLLALVDYRYRFMYVNVGSPGRCNDSSIYEASRLRQEHQKSILDEMSRTINEVEVPALIIGDSAFRFSQHLMKPYPYSVTAGHEEKTFNYALSASRRVVENAFGHLKARFRRIGKGIDNKIENAAIIIKACCVLHNFLNESNDEINQKWLLAQSSREAREGRQHEMKQDNLPKTLTYKIMLQC